MAERYQMRQRQRQQAPSYSILTYFEEWLLVKPIFVFENVGGTGPGKGAWEGHLNLGR